MNYIEITIRGAARIRTSVINELFLIGSTGVQEGDGEDFIYFQHTEKTTEQLRAFLQNLTKEKTFGYSVQEKKEENWNRLWESNYEPIEIGTYCYIYASFHEKKEGFEHIIQINPKMSFGTGHHQTTFLMVEAMKTLNLKNKQVLDLGCGTGILAILASKEHAKEVTAVDIDTNAIQNTEENIQLNQASAIHYFQGTIAEVNKKFDVILANINRNILLEDAEKISQRLQQNGRLVLSGFYSEDKDEILTCYKQFGLHAEGYSNKNNWATVILKSW